MCRDRIQREKEGEALATAQGLVWADMGELDKDNFLLKNAAKWSDAKRPRRPLCQEFDASTVDDPVDLDPPTDEPSVEDSQDYWASDDAAAAAAVEPVSLNPSTKEPAVETTANQTNVDKTDTETAV